jgi:hypothetical protein
MRRICGAGCRGAALFGWAIAFPASMVKPIAKLAITSLMRIKISITPSGDCDEIAVLQGYFGEDRDILDAQISGVV